MERLEQIVNRLNEYDRYLQRELSQATDKNVALYENWIDCVCDIEKILKELRQLKSQGKILELPCAIGDTVYEINYDKSECPYCIGIDGCFHCTKRNPKNVCQTRFDFYMRNRFGKDIFLTREETESALRNMQS